MSRCLLTIAFIFLHLALFGQQWQGCIQNKQTHEGIPFAQIYLSAEKKHVLSDVDGRFSVKLKELPQQVLISAIGFEEIEMNLNESMLLDSARIELQDKSFVYGKEVVVKGQYEGFDMKLPPTISGVRINPPGRVENIVIGDNTPSRSTANPRQIFAKIPGLNIWENDGAGVQLGIGGRGLSPNRAANFNTRQNGYDISADALGYPESYYTPPFEALKGIEIIRGAASLQYGTQFGGLLNFSIKDPVSTSPIEFTTRNTGGSFGYFGTFNRISGRYKRFEYQAYYQYKRGDGWRKQSEFQQHQGFAQWVFISMNQRVGVLNIRT